MNQPKYRKLKTLDAIIADDENEIKKLKDYFEERDDEGCTPLHIACRNGKTKVSEYLINRNVYLDDEDSFGLTPIHYAAGIGNLEIVKLLANRKCNLECIDSDGKTPLHKAVESGDNEVVKYLVEKNVNVDMADVNGLLPIHIALEKNNVEIIKVLLPLYENESFDCSIIKKSAINQEIDKHIDPSLICRFRSKGVHLLKCPIKLDCGHVACLKCVLENATNNRYHILICCIKNIKQYEIASVFENYTHEPYQLALNENLKEFASSLLKLCFSSIDITRTEKHLNLDQMKLDYYEEEIEILLESLKIEFDTLKRKLHLSIDKFKHKIIKQMNKKITMNEMYALQTLFDVRCYRANNKIVKKKFIGILKIHRNENVKIKTDEELNNVIEFIEGYKMSDEGDNVYNKEELLNLLKKVIEKRDKSKEISDVRILFQLEPLIASVKSDADLKDLKEAFKYVFMFLDKNDKVPNKPKYIEDFVRNELITDRKSLVIEEITEKLEQLSSVGPEEIVKSLEKSFENKDNTPNEYEIMAFQLLEYGTLLELKELFQVRPDIRMNVLYRGENMFLSAIRFERFDIVKYLYEEKQADLNTFDVDNRNPLQLAIQTNEKQDILNYLIEIGCPFPNKQLEIIFNESKINSTEFDLNFVDDFGATALHYIAAIGDVKKLNSIKTLLVDFDFKKKDKLELTCFDRAAINGRLEMLKELFKMFNVNNSINNIDILKSVLKMSLRFSTNTEIVQHCFDIFKKIKYNIFQEEKYLNTYINGKTTGIIKEKVKCLLSNGGDILVKDNDGRNFLTYLSKIDNNIGSFLLKLGLSLNDKNKLNQNICHFAAMNGQINVLIYAHEMKVAINEIDSEGYTPLMYAVENGFINVVEWLLTADPSVVNLKNKYGYNVLDIALIGKRFEIARLFKTYKISQNIALLLPSKIDLSDLSDFLLYPLIYKNLKLKIYTSANFVYLTRGLDRGREAWHYALVKPWLLKEYLERTGSGKETVDISNYGKIIYSGWGKDPPKEIVQKIEDEYGIFEKTNCYSFKQSLKYIENCNLNFLSIDECLEKLKIQLTGSNIFHLSAAFGRNDLLLWLYINNFDIQSKDKYGQTALLYATMNGQKESVIILKLLGLTRLFENEHIFSNQMNIIRNKRRNEIDFDVFLQQVIFAIDVYLEATNMMMPKIENLSLLINKIRQKYLKKSSLYESIYTQVRFTKSGRINSIQTIDFHKLKSNLILSNYNTEEKIPLVELDKEALSYLIQFDDNDIVGKSLNDLSGYIFIRERKQISYSKFPTGVTLKQADMNKKNFQAVIQSPDFLFYKKQQQSNSSCTSTSAYVINNDITEVFILYENYLLVSFSVYFIIWDFKIDENVATQTFENDKIKFIESNHSKQTIYCSKNDEEKNINIFVGLAHNIFIYKFDVNERNLSKLTEVQHDIDMISSNNIKINITHLQRKNMITLAISDSKKKNITIVRDAFLEQLKQSITIKDLLRDSNIDDEIIKHFSMIRFIDNIIFVKMQINENEWILCRVNVDALNDKQGLDIYTFNCDKLYCIDDECEHFICETSENYHRVLKLLKVSNKTPNVLTTIHVPFRGNDETKYNFHIKDKKFIWVDLIMSKVHHIDLLNQEVHNLLNQKWYIEKIYCSIDEENLLVKIKRYDQMIEIGIFNVFSKELQCPSLCLDLKSEEAIVYGQNENYLILYNNERREILIYKLRNMDGKFEFLLLDKNVWKNMFVFSGRNHWLYYLRGCYTTSGNKIFVTFCKTQEILQISSFSVENQKEVIEKYNINLSSFFKENNDAYEVEFLITNKESLFVWSEDTCVLYGWKTLKDKTHAKTIRFSEPILKVLDVVDYNELVVKSGKTVYYVKPFTEGFNKTELFPHKSDNFNIKVQNNILFVIFEDIKQTKVYELNPYVSLKQLCNPIEIQFYECCIISDRIIGHTSNNDLCVVNLRGQNIYEIKYPIRRYLSSFAFRENIIFALHNGVIEIYYY